MVKEELQVRCFSPLFGLFLWRWTPNWRLAMERTGPACLLRLEFNLDGEASKLADFELTTLFFEGSKSLRVDSISSHSQLKC